MYGFLIRNLLRHWNVFSHVIRALRGEHLGYFLWPFNYVEEGQKNSLFEYTNLLGEGINSPVTVKQIAKRYFVEPSYIWPIGWTCAQSLCNSCEKKPCFLFVYFLEWPASPMHFAQIVKMTVLRGLVNL